MNAIGKIALVGATALTLAACGTHRESPAQHAAQTGQPMSGLSSDPVTYDSTGAIISSNPPTIASYSSQLPPQDEGFLRQAIADGTAEIELAQFAYQRASSFAVRDFARRMVNDHTVLAERLRTLAARKGVSPLATPPAMIPSDLANRSGDSFDEAYMEHMVRDHDQALDLFAREAANGGDIEVRAMAEATLPTLETHRSMAEQVADEVD